MADPNQATLDSAVELHQKGDFSAAAPLYRKVISKDPENAAALHLLGVLHHQLGEQEKAVELIGKALALRPNVPAFHANLAEAYRALGRFDRAVGCCRAALRLWPEYPEALCNLGVSLQGQGKREEAIEPLKKALELKPDFVMAMNNLAITLRELDRKEESLAYFRKAVLLEPNFAPARTNLGQMLLDLGKPDEALPHCLEAVRLQPDLAAMHHNLGNAYAVLGRSTDARGEYLEALRINDRTHQAAAKLGALLKSENKPGEAIPWLKQAVEHDPGNAEYWESLAEAHSDREDPAEAIPCWEKVLALSPEEKAATHLSFGWSLQEEGRLKEAEEHYLTARRIEPESAAALLNIGGLEEELGEMQKAEASFRAALALQPAYALPHARLATLLRGKLPEADFQALEARLGDETLAPEPRSHLLFALAHVLDSRGEYPRAADSLARANALRVELDGERRRYDPAEHEKFVANLIQTFNSEQLSKLAGSGHPSRRPIFVFGLPRSGTTLVEQVLSSHPAIFGAGELRLARGSFEAIPSVLDPDRASLELVPLLDSASLVKLGDMHLEKLALHDSGGSDRIVDKMPDNYMYLGLLSLIFPRATFIHCRRDLRDIAVSCWMTDFRSIRWANRPEHIATRFAQYRRLMDHWRSVLPASIHEVSYEDTVDDLEGVARRLLEAAGVAWDPACLEFHKNERPVRTASITQVRQPIYKRSVARWKNYEGPMKDLFERLKVNAGDGPAAPE